MGTWYSFNGSNAFDTSTELKSTSSMATASLLNVLATGSDQYKVNQSDRVASPVGAISRCGGEG